MSTLFFSFPLFYTISQVIACLASKLRPHQREGVQFLFDCTMGMKGFEGEGCILADDMGLGKIVKLEIQMSIFTSYTSNNHKWCCISLGPAGVVVEIYSTFFSFYFFFSFMRLRCFKNLSNFDLFLFSYSLGKTLMSITIMWTLLNQGKIKGQPAVKKVVVACPTSLVGSYHNDDDCGYSNNDNHHGACMFYLPISFICSSVVHCSSLSLSISTFLFSFF